MRLAGLLRDDDQNQLLGVLRLAGVTRVVDGRLRIRNRIYQKVFDRRWVTAHMPDAELRRQRSAFRRGATAASVAWAGIVVLIGTLAGAALRSSAARR